MRRRKSKMGESNVTIHGFDIIYIHDYRRVKIIIADIIILILIDTCMYG